MSQELIKRLRDELIACYKRIDEDIESVDQVITDADIHIGDRENGPTFKQYRNQALLALLPWSGTATMDECMQAAEECARLMMK